MRWFGATEQIAHVLPLLLGAQAVILLIRLAAGDAFPGWLYFSASFVAIAFWPLATMLFLATQRRPVGQDEHRPI